MPDERFVFTRYADNPRRTIEMRIGGPELTTPELVDAFRGFLLACGYEGAHRIELRDAIEVEP